MAVSGPLTDHGSYDRVRSCKTDCSDNKENLAAKFVKKEKGGYDSDKLCDIQGTREGKLKLVVKT